jgi:hypothetical protein
MRDFRGIGVASKRWLANLWDNTLADGAPQSTSQNGNSVSGRAKFLLVSM